MTRIYFVARDQPLEVDETAEQVAKAFEGDNLAKFTVYDSAVYVNLATVAYWQESESRTWRPV